MIKFAFFVSALSLAVFSPAEADDRPLTREEAVSLAGAVSEMGCSGGKLEFDDGVFEVDNARCADGKIYDLKFDPSMMLLHQDLED